MIGPANTDSGEWHPCEVCQSVERKPYLAIMHGGVFVPHSTGDSHGLFFERVTGVECPICTHVDTDLDEPIYLCFDCVTPWLELTALSIPKRVVEPDDE